MLNVQEESQHILLHRQAHDEGLSRLLQGRNQLFPIQRHHYTAYLQGFSLWSKTTTSHWASILHAVQVMRGERLSVEWLLQFGQFEQTAATVVFSREETERCFYSDQDNVQNDFDLVWPKVIEKCALPLTSNTILTGVANYFRALFHLGYTKGRCMLHDDLLIIRCSYPEHQTMDSYQCYATIDIGNIRGFFRELLPVRW